MLNWFLKTCCLYHFKGGLVRDGSVRRRYSRKTYKSKGPCKTQSLFPHYGARKIQTLQKHILCLMLLRNTPSMAIVPRTRVRDSDCVVRCVCEGYVVGFVFSGFCSWMDLSPMVVCAMT